MQHVICRPIGFVRSRFDSVQGMPIQTVTAEHEPAFLDVCADFEVGLTGIEEFEYLILVTHLHLTEKESLFVKPFLDDQKHGVFSTRAPARPNKLGLSTVRLIKRDGLTLTLSGNDMLDGTPVLDIKPYIPAFDVRQTSRIGWYANRLASLEGTKSDGRMSE